MPGSVACRPYREEGDAQDHLIVAIGLWGLATISPLKAEEGGTGHYLPGGLATLIEIPTDRIIDSIDQSDFLTGKRDNSNRDGFVVYVGNDLFGVKWRNWKMMFKEVERGTDAKKTYDFPRFYNLYADPKEEYPLTKATAGHFWTRWPMGAILTEHAHSLNKEPPIKPGTPDPYVPKKSQ